MEGRYETLSTKDLMNGRKVDIRRLVMIPVKYGYLLFQFGTAQAVLLILLRNTRLTSRQIEFVFFPAGTRLSTLVSTPLSTCTFCTDGFVGGEAGRMAGIFKPALSHSRNALGGKWSGIGRVSPSVRPGQATVRGR